MFEQDLKAELKKYYPNVVEITHPDFVYLENILLHLEIASVLFTRVINDLYPELKLNRPIAVGSALIFMWHRCNTNVSVLAGYLERNNLLLAKFASLSSDRKSALIFANDKLPSIFKVLLLLMLFYILTNKLQDDITLDFDSYKIILQELLRRERLSASKIENCLKENSDYPTFKAILNAYEIILLRDVFAFNLPAAETFEDYVKSLYKFTEVPVFFKSFTGYYLARLLNPETFTSLDDLIQTTVVPRSDSLPSLASATSSAASTPMTSPAMPSSKSPLLNFAPTIPVVAQPTGMPTFKLAHLEEAQVSEPHSEIAPPWPPATVTAPTHAGHFGSKRSLLLL